MAGDASLTPCAGRCSTVFGDSVCRGCLRYSKEVIDWNAYDPDTQYLVWQRLDHQVDQIVLPLIAVAQMDRWQQYKQASMLKLPKDASEGRWRYEVFKVCVRHPAQLVDTGLALEASSLRPLWHHIEKKLYALAVAMYEIAWVRAASIVSEDSPPDLNRK